MTVYFILLTLKLCAGENSLGTQVFPLGPVEIMWHYCLSHNAPFMWTSLY